MYFVIEDAEIDCRFILPAKRRVGGLVQADSAEEALENLVAGKIEQAERDCEYVGLHLGSSKAFMAEPDSYNFEFAFYCHCDDPTECNHPSGFFARLPLDLRIERASDATMMELMGVRPLFDLEAIV